MTIKGVHHVTAITSSAEKIYEFFTYVLGMRLVKKTVNQDDIQTYHMFFADDIGSPGTDMTFFDFPGIPKGVHGTNEISRTAFRVPSDAALDYWIDRFDRYQVQHKGIEEEFGKKCIYFVDFDGQQYQLISDEKDRGVKGGIPWQKGPIPLDYAITGLGPVHITIANFEFFRRVLEHVFSFTLTNQKDNLYLFEVGQGGNGASVIVENKVTPPLAQQGYGTIHHLAFRVEDRIELDKWDEHIRSFGFQTSGYVDRHFFESNYVQVAPQILFELATDGPGFMGDEPYETLGEKLSLPPFLEAERETIESLVRPINTIRSTKKFTKE